MVLVSWAWLSLCEGIVRACPSQSTSLLKALDEMCSHFGLVKHYIIHSSVIRSSNAEYSTVVCTFLLEPPQKSTAHHIELMGCTPVLLVSWTIHRVWGLLPGFRVEFRNFGTMEFQEFPHVNPRNGYSCGVLLHAHAHE